MTAEEAIDELEVIHERLSHPEDCEQGVYSFRDGNYLEALDMAIKALEQQLVLDKIRAEIEDLRLHKAGFLTSDSKVCVDSQEVLDIIDKYKAESGGEK